MTKRNSETIEEYRIRNNINRRKYYVDNIKIEKDRMKQYSNTTNGKISHNNSAKKFRENNPDKHKAHCIVRSYIRRGLLIKGVCIICGDRNVHAHHKDYSKPIDVIWVCPQHHKDIHNKVIGV